MFLRNIKCVCTVVLTRHYSKQVIEMKYLNIAEKHDAAKTIAGLLSNGTARRREGYSVYNKIFDFDATVKGKNCKMVMTSVSGHLMQLAFLSGYRNWRNVDPQALFDAPIRKVCPEDYQPIKRTIEREIKGCQGLIVWTDCDREGENIGFEIIEVCRSVKPNIVVYRATFSEITGASVRRALDRLTAPDKRQSDAVDIRSELDLRTGAAITRLQTLRLQRLFPEKIAQKLISYGSCQIPTLGFVVERYKEIEAFISEAFWKIKVFHTIDDLTVEFNWARNRLFDKQACEDYLLICLADPKATVESVTVKPKSKWRPTPMDTVEMEKLGSRKLKLSAKETMTIAEKLYTKGIISYPRTETNQFSKEIDLKPLVEQQLDHSVWGSFAQRVLEWGINPRNGNKSDQAHPPIHPTKLVTNLEGNEGRVYELICRHFLACISKDAVGSETVVHINIAGEKFTATGLCIYERNYLDVYVYDKWNAKQIHKYEQGQVFDPTEICMHEGATTAPPLLTEADLIALMEKHGIGTDATHAEHINTIKERGYIGVVDKGNLVPGVIGMGLYEGYDAMELVLAKPHLRAEFEADLKRICLGEKDPKSVLQAQIVKYKEAYKQIIEKITAMDEKIALRLNETPVVNTQSENRSNAAETNSNVENYTRPFQELMPCPKCSIGVLALRPKKNQSGFFISCLNFPDCRNAVWLPDDCKEPEVLNESCPQCGSDAKMLKFKFSTSYYRTIFNAPSGRYKSCLRCDSHFRETFNINVDTVKKAGRIVAESRSTAVTNAPVIPSTSSTSAPANTRKTNKPKTKLKTSTTTKEKTIATNIRSFFSSASSRQENVESVRQNAIVQYDDIPLNELFNDDFEDALMQAEAQSNIATVNSERTHQEFSSDIAAEFEDDGDFANFSWGTRGTTASSNMNRNPNTSTTNNFESNDDSFLILLRSDEGNIDDYSWGTGRRRSSIAEQANKRPKLQQTSVFHLTNTTSGTSNPTTNSDQSPPIIKCSGCHQEAKELTVRKEGINKGRRFYTCPKSERCKFFQWYDENTVAESSTAATTTQTSQRPVHNSETSSSTRTPRSDVPKCNCGVAASSLTVRKEGPNKGRPFFSCSNREKSCGFFKWADEDDNQASTSSSRGSNQTWGSNSTSASTSSGNNPSNKDNKKRKCGLCRQEGHTRLKCPKKAEFEY